MAGETYTLRGVTYELLERKLVSGEYLRTVRRHGVDFKEWTPYAYMAVVVGKEVARERAVEA